MQGTQGYLRLLASTVPVTADYAFAQTRQYKAVVQNGNVTKALRQLTTHIKEEKLMDKWKAAKLYVKPSHQRVIQQKETKKKLNRQKFQSMMYWVMQAKSRYSCRTLQANDWLWLLQNELVRAVQFHLLVAAGAFEKTLDSQSEAYDLAFSQGS